MFPRSYLFSLEKISEQPSDFVEVPLPAGTLVISADYSCSVRAAGTSFLALIGYCIDLDKPTSITQGVAASLLKTGLQGGSSAILAASDHLLGRFTAICHLGGDWTVFSDACATRTTYYAEDFPIVASHSALIGSIINHSPRKDLYAQIRWGLPGTASPVSRVRLLPANFALNLESRSPFRFWPRSPRVERSVENILPLLSQTILESADAIAAKWKPVLSLTAGLDSRTTLAAFHRHRGMTSFTYDRGLIDRPDVRVANRISERLKLKHRTLHVPKTGNIIRISDYKHIAALPHLYPVWFPEKGTVHVRSNLGEIGRAFWRKALMPKGAGTLISCLDPAIWPEIILHEEQKEAPLRHEAAQLVREEMSRFLQLARYEPTSNSEASLLGYDGWDLVYWEHRMSTWHAPLVLGSDGAFDTAIVFNSRRSLELLLAVPLQDRIQSTLFRRFVDNQCPELRDIPFNPRPVVDLRRLMLRTKRLTKRLASLVPRRQAGGWHSRPPYN